MTVGGRSAIQFEGYSILAECSRRTEILALMANPSWCRVLIYCASCGSRPVRRMDTGEERVVVYSIRKRDVEGARDDLAHSACLFCNEPLELKVIQD